MQSNLYVCSPKKNGQNQYAKIFNNSSTVKICHKRIEKEKYHTGTVTLQNSVKKECVIVLDSNKYHRLIKH